MKVGYLAAILKWYKYFTFVSNMVVISAYIYGVKMIKKFQWFSREGSMEPPYALTEVRGTLCSQVLIVQHDQNCPHDDATMV